MLWGLPDSHTALTGILFEPLASESPGLLVKAQAPGPSPHLPNQYVRGGAQARVCLLSSPSDSAICPPLRIVVWHNTKDGGSSGRLDSGLKRQVKSGCTVSGRQG